MSELDVERLARAICAAGIGHYRGWDHAEAAYVMPTKHDEEAAAIAAEYDRLSLAEGSAPRPAAGRAERDNTVIP